MTRFDKRKAKLEKAQFEIRQQFLAQVNKRKYFKEKKPAFKSLAQACRIAMKMGSNPSFIEHMKLALELFEEAGKL